MVDADQLLLAGDRRAARPRRPPSRPPCVVSSSPWIPQHLLLHLLRHPLQVAHPHRRSFPVCVVGQSAERGAAAAGRGLRSADLADVDEVSAKIRRASAMR